MLGIRQQHLLLLLALSGSFLSLTRAQGVDPTIIETCTTETTQITVQVPASTDTEPVDVMFLFDDTGTFAKASSQLANQFSALVVQLTAAFPSVDFGYGVAKYEDYGGVGIDYGGQFSDSRPAILNQPIVTAAELGGDVTALNTLIVDALRRTAPENGGDIPESAIEGIFNVAVGSGFDGNGDGSFLGIDGTQVAGATATQTAPDASGDVPPISSLDPSILSGGTAGGGRFRPGSKKLLIVATDACTVAPFSGEIPATISTEFSTEPSTEFSCAGGVRYGSVGDALIKADSTIARSIAPLGAHTVPETVAALVAAGIKVVGLSADAGATASGSGPSDSPSVFLSALARLTGSVDANGDALVSQIDVNNAEAVQAAILNAISTFVAPPINVEVSPVGCDTIPGLTLAFDPPTAEGVAAGSNVTFDVSFDIDPALAAGSCQFQFVDGTGTILSTDAIQLQVCQTDSESPSLAPTTGATTIAPSPAASTSGPSGAPSGAPIVGTQTPTGPGTGSPSSPPTMLPTAFPTARISEGSPTNAPSALPTITPTVGGTKRPTESPSAGPSLGPSVSGAPSRTARTKAPTARAPHRTSLFGQKTGANFFTTTKTSKYGGIRFDFTHPIPGKGGGGGGDCWGFDCVLGGGKGHPKGQGKGYSKGTGSGKGKGGSKGTGSGKGGSKGKAGGSKGKGYGKAGGSKGIKGGKGKGESVSTSGNGDSHTWYYVGKGASKTSKTGSKGAAHIFDVIFVNDPVNNGATTATAVNNDDSKTQKQKIRDRKRARRIDMNKARRERIRQMNTAPTKPSSGGGGGGAGAGGGGDGTSDPADKFVLVTDMNNDAPDDSESGIVFIGNSLINNGNDRVRRRTA